MLTTKDLVYLSLNTDHKQNQPDIWDNSHFEPMLSISKCCHAPIEISELECFCVQCGHNIDPKNIPLSIHAESIN